MVDIPELSAWGEQWAPVAALVEAGAASITMLIAALAAIYAARQVKIARLDREDRGRPFVTVFFRASHGVVCNIVIKNEGLTVARDVRFSFNPEWTSARPERNRIRESKVWREGISTLVPGQEIAMLADIVHERAKSDLPRTYEVVVSYASASHGRWGKPKPITDTYILDLDVFFGYSTATVWSLHDVAEALRRIDAKMSGWTEGAAGGPLRVLARDGDRRDDEDLAECESYSGARTGGADVDAGRSQHTERADVMSDRLSVGNSDSSFVSEYPIDRPPPVAGPTEGTEEGR